MGYNKERYRTLKNIAYHILFCVWYVVSLMPLCVLYRVSDLAAMVLFHVVGYRRKVVYENLQKSYPDLSETELRDIERRFYTHFCDLMVESVKYFTISKSEMRRRMQVKGIDLLRETCGKGKSAGVFLGHYANWEWVSSMPLWIEPEVCLCTQLYHPMENLVTDRLLMYTRERFGGVCINAEHSIRQLMHYKIDKKPVLVGFIADQAPYWTNIHYWTNFLNHPDTPVFTGAEKIMKKLDMDVYYLDVQRVKRGHYVAEFKLITDKPKETKEFELTEIYTRMLEETINRAPAYWLWSHRRWKRTKEEWERMNRENGK